MAPRVTRRCGSFLRVTCMRGQDGSGRRGEGGGRRAGRRGVGNTVPPLGLESSAATLTITFLAVVLSVNITNSRPWRCRPRVTKCHPVYHHSTETPAPTPTLPGRHGAWCNRIRTPFCSVLHGKTRLVKRHAMTTAVLGEEGSSFPHIASAQKLPSFPSPSHPLPYLRTPMPLSHPSELAASSRSPSAPFSSIVYLSYHNKVGLFPGAAESRKSDLRGSIKATGDRPERSGEEVSLVFSEAAGVASPVIPTSLAPLAPRIVLLDFKGTMRLPESSSVVTQLDWNLKLCSLLRD
ncbi:hypothetical protein E2C01_025716 [Portunus trituberculatus]|uniref:Uncharacterized protein n=1 Tax=Portunus trituberculatus TaxID=210409 RepID=A0A5B7EIP4_PORTR|nr:hypothetical protein [Portunus trituberculatus]